MSLYPAQIDNTSSLPTAVDNLTPVTGDVVNRLRAAIIQTQSELGVKPSGLYTTVRNRLDVLENILNNSISFTASGDLSGSSSSQNVIGLRGRIVSAAAPVDGYVLTWVASNNDWEPIAPTGGSSGSPTGPAGGNLSGTYPNPTVAKINGISVPSAPSANQILIASSSTVSSWSLIFNSNVSASAAISGSKITSATTGAIGVITLSNDLGGTGALPTVLKINSATVPAAGALTTGNVLQVTGASALSYGPVNLAGGANFVTGLLPTANQTSQNMSGDVTGTTATSVVNKIRGNSVAVQTLTSSQDGYVLTWDNADGYWKGIPASGGAPSGTAGGDLSGNYPNPNVSKLNGITVTTTPTTGYVLTATSSSSATWQAATGGGGNTSVSAAEGRLTLTTGVPFTTSDVIGASTIYYTPYVGNGISLFDGTSTWTQITFTELSLALSSLTSDKNYDVFVYNNSGTATLELSAAWTDDVTRADALTRQNGIWVKNSAKTRRLVGTIRTTGTTITEDSSAKRFVWNVKNAKNKMLKVTESTNSWSYNLIALRPVNNNTSNCFEFVQGDDMLVSVTAMGIASNNLSGSNIVSIGIGVDSTTVSSANMMGANALSNEAEQMSAFYKGYLSIGYHKITWLESGNSNVTFYGTAGSATIVQTGMIGEILS